MKTLSELAAQAGVNKSTMYRYVMAAGIQPCNAATMRTDKVQRYDATAEQAIMQHFAQRRNGAATVRNDAQDKSATMRNDAMQRQIEALQRQLDHAAHEHDLLQHQLDQVTNERQFLRDEMDAQRTFHDSECSRVRDEYAEQLDHLRMAHGEQVQQMQSIIDQLRQQLDQMQTNHAEQLDRLRADHDSTVLRMQSTIDTLTAQLDQERQHSREQSDKVAQLCDQSQRLQLAAMNSRPLDQITDQQTQEKPLTFWQRLFKRK